MRKLWFPVLACAAGLSGSALAAGSAAGARDTKLQTVHSSFLLLRHNRPTKPPGVLTSGSPSKYGLAVSQAVVQKLPGGASLWLIPGTQDTCLAFLDPAESYTRTSLYETCQGDAIVLKYGAYAFISDPTHEYIFGVEPGNARDITATMNNGGKTEAATRYGVYAFSTRRPRFIRTLNTPGGPLRPTTPQWG